MLDSKADDFTVELLPKAPKRGALLTVKVDSVEPADEVYVHCRELGWLRQVLSTEDGIHWTVRLQVQSDMTKGDYQVLVVVRDRAGNRAEQKHTLTVEAK